MYFEIESESTLYTHPKSHDQTLEQCTAHEVNTTFTIVITTQPWSSNRNEHGEKPNKNIKVKTDNARTNATLDANSSPLRHSPPPQGGV